MDRYLNLILIAVLLVIVNSLKSQVSSDSVFSYLKNNDKCKTKGCFSMELVIYNESNDSICITNFNKYVPHYSDMNFRGIPQCTFYWKLLSLSNKDPENIININLFAPTTCYRNKYEKKTVNILIPKKGTFVSDIYLLESLFVVYAKGFYKLCLYTKENSSCVATTLIEVK